MSLTDDLAEKLAFDVLELERTSGNDTLAAEVSKVIGASSTTLQDAYLTAVRNLRADRQARKYMDDLKKKGESEINIVAPADPDMIE